MSGGLEMLLDPVGTIIHGSRKDKKATPAPAPTPEPVAPMPDVEAANAAAKRRAAAGRSRSGRLSTILTAGGRETLGCHRCVTPPPLGTAPCEERGCRFV